MPDDGGTPNSITNPNHNLIITMKEQTVVSLEINGTEVELKSRRESGSPSGWALIAFTPCCSLRTTRIHIPSKLTSFASAIAAAVDDYEDESVDQIESAIKSITLDHDM
jgi:hypothetical protein